MVDKKTSGELIGGEYCKAKLSPALLPRQGQNLTPYELDALWRIFQAIGTAWKNLHPSALDSSNLKSSWLDFIEAKTNSDPSYVSEYSNAVLCVDELHEIYDKDKSLDEIYDPEIEKEAFKLLFFKNGIPLLADPDDPKKPPQSGPPMTRLAHTKKYVIDEFIRVNVVASGFKSFGAPQSNGKNYKGYLGGSRYNLRAKVRDYKPELENPK